MSDIRDAVDNAELDRHLRAISRGVRLSGSTAEAEAFDYLESQLTGWGYQVSRFASDALIGYPLAASLDLLGAAPVAIPTNGYSLSPATPDEGITASLRYARAGGAADYAGLDVAGCIVITDGLATPAKELAARDAGAVGQIHINDDHIHEMCISPVWGTPTPETAPLLPRVPAVAVARADGERLLERLRKGDVRVRLSTRPFREWIKIPGLTAELPGQGSDEFVMFSGHVDSWHYGAMDNGSANATQLEVGRLLAQRRAKLRRGVRIAFWSGHSHGRYAGSAWYADTFWHDLHDRCVCHVNIDSVGGTGATVLDEAASMAETHAFGREMMRDVAGIELDYRRISRSSDQSFWGHGIPMLFAALSEQPAGEGATANALGQLFGGGGKSGGLGWWWHTPEDTIDKIDPALHRRDTRIYAETLWQFVTRERHPIDPAAGAREMAAAIATYHQDARGAIDLGATAELARDLAAAIDRANLERLPVEQANRTAHELCRLLIPVNYTRNGPFDQDLALSAPPVPGLSDAATLATLDPHSDAYHFLHTRLTRHRNRVEHALRSAGRLLPT